MILNKIYNFLWRVMPPILKYYLRHRAKKSPQYAYHWGERFGEAYEQPVQNAIWIHAVSVGETRAAAPLIEALQTYFPEIPLLLTQMTPTGRATAQVLYPQAQCRYLPYDHPNWVRQFITEHRPCFGILMETEIWPNLINICVDENVPLFLANARLSERSLRGYRWVRALVAPALAKLSGCYAQTDDDARRLFDMGAVSVQVCGNTKYDIVPSVEDEILSRDFRNWIGKRKVFLAVSTRVHHDVDEAELILQQWQSYHGEALLVLVPRHPERFESAFYIAKTLGLKVQKRSENKAIDLNTRVWIGDSMGELFAYCLIADIVFVGGSLVDTGCQNIIEPLSCGKPVLFGDSIYNFQAVCEGALAAKAARQVHDVQELCTIVQEYLHNSQQYVDFSKNAQEFIAAHQGASERIAKKIVQQIKQR